MLNQKKGPQSRARREEIEFEIDVVSKNIAHLKQKQKALGGK